MALFLILVLHVALEFLEITSVLLKDTFPSLLIQVMLIKWKLGVAIYAVDLGWSHSWRRIWIEVDSKYVMDLMCSYRLIMPWCLHSD